MMQKSENNKNVAIILLVFLFIMIFPAYYLLYYRHRLYYDLCVEKIRKINAVLLGDSTDKLKLQGINSIWTDKDDQMVANENFTQLGDVMALLKKEILDSVENENSREEQRNMMKDDLRRINFEKAQFYVSNNVLDNCLSTLKHETMYYPPRIAQLVDGKSENLDAIAELVNYYRLLYGVFSAQAMRIVERLFKFDPTSLQYLLDLLKKQNGGVKPSLEVTETGDSYMLLRVGMKNLKLTPAQCRQLFTESTADLNFLQCRQIVRDFGELANARGCGISARCGKDNETIIEIKISKTIWKNSKLLS